MDNVTFDSLTKGPSYGVKMIDGGTPMPVARINYRKGNKELVPKISKFVFRPL